MAYMHNSQTQVNRNTGFISNYMSEKFGEQDEGDRQSESEVGEDLEFKMKLEETN